MPFPDIPFHDFADFIQLNFSADITLSTVLTLLFTLTQNPEFLNLHGRQQHSKLQGESSHDITGWMKVLSRLLLGVRLRETRQELFSFAEGIILTESQNYTTASVSTLSRKLNHMITLLRLNTFKPNGKLRHRRRAISHDTIQPIHLICPQAHQCETLSCSAYGLTQNTQFAQIPRVTLLKGSDVCNFAFVLSGHCSRCNTTYYADHDRAWNNTEQRYDQYLLNSAVYLKLGQSTWADRTFTNSVVNATYSFHASPSAFADYWNESHGRQASAKLTRRHIWQAFIAETVRMVAQDDGTNLSVPSNSNIDDITTAAFDALGSGGIIKAAQGHACDECSHAQKFGPNEQHLDPSDYKPVSMCVVDGIVMAPTVCTFIYTIY